MAARGAAELRWATERRRSDSGASRGARLAGTRLQASSLLRAHSDPAALRPRRASAGAEPLSRRSLAAVVRFSGRARADECWLWLRLRVDPVPQGRRPKNHVCLPLGRPKTNRLALVYNTCERSLRRRLSNRRVEDSKKK